MAREQAFNDGDDVTGQSEGCVEECIEDPVSGHCCRKLAGLAVVSACLYAAVSCLSWRFNYGSATAQRPILVVLLLLAATFVVYLYAIRVVVHASQDRRLVTLIVWPAILFRMTLLLSVPIQEVDIYRYLWDGAVSVVGVSPFRYSPAQVQTAATASTTDEELLKLLTIRDRQPAVAEALNRVHFAELPTIYPPVSQWVFAAVAYLTPANASVTGRMLFAKAWFIGFDLATLLVVISLLRVCGKPVGLCLIYAWCPLLLKEVANSGHLDAVAVFLTTLAVYFAVRLWMTRDRRPATSSRAILFATLMAVTLSLAIGAKLYPVILAPLLFVCCARRIGWRWIAVPLAVFGGLTMMLLWPMAPTRLAPAGPVSRTVASDEVASDEVASDEVASAPDIPVPPVAKTPTNDPSLGVRTFLRRWEMNDFIFLLLVENLKPTANLPPERVAWFSVFPQVLRQRIVVMVTACCGIPARQVPFLLTRSITVVAFLMLAGYFAWRVVKEQDGARVCEAAFLTVAWFWLLCPTQNPWYWTWALPLLPFARGRAWLAVSGLVLLYYLRFWFGYHCFETPVLATRYAGTAFFDFVVTWIEFAPWLAWLAVDAYRRPDRRCRSRVGWYNFRPNHCSTAGCRASRKA